MLDELDQLLRWYLEHVRPLFTSTKEGPLFLSESGKRIKKDTARDALQRRLECLGFTSDEMFSPHQRHHPDNCVEVNGKQVNRERRLTNLRTDANSKST